mgnify:CR=1 FL=1
MINNRFARSFQPAILLSLSMLVSACGSDGGGESDAVGRSAVDEQQSPVLVWSDEFDEGESPSIEKWRVETGYGENGWGNDEWQQYQDSTDNLFIENGNLVISAQCDDSSACGKRDGSITSAKITTQNKFNVKYGNIQARIKMPSGLGVWPAFWMLGADIPDKSWPQAGEIDIVEMHYFYSDNKTTHFSTHWAGPTYAEGERPSCSSGLALANDEVHSCYTAHKTFEEPLTDDFHVYEVSWSERSIVGKIDGIVYFTQAIDPDSMEEFLKSYFLILNVAVGGTLGGTGGPNAAMDWSDSNQTDMLIDWVRVYETAMPETASLLSGSGDKLGYNRIINTAEYGGAYAGADLNSTAVTPIEGDTVLEISYLTTLSQDGGTPKGYSGAIFDFNSADLSTYSSVVFSLNAADFPNFQDMGLEFQDSRSTGTNGIGKVMIRTNNYTPENVAGTDWQTFEIPFSDFAGVDFENITAVGFFNPYDANNNLIAGTLYLDGIRFESNQGECSEASSVAFDTSEYNPATTHASVTVTDLCSASSLAVVKVATDTGEITVGVQLNAAGEGETVFKLLDPQSACTTNDENSIIVLSGPLTATYIKTYIDVDGVQQPVTVTAAAGVDPSAPITTIPGDSQYLYATDENQALGFLPDTDYFFSDFGSSSVFDGGHSSDGTFNKVFSVSDLAGQQAVLALYDFSDGFTSSMESFNFKVKDLPGDVVTVKFGQDGGSEQAFSVDLTSYAGSTAIGDDWYDVRIPMTQFPDVGLYDYIVILSNNSSSADFAYLITDIFFEESAGLVGAVCALDSDDDSGGDSGGEVDSGPFDVTLTVDMSAQTLAAEDVVYVSGGWDNWCGGCNPLTNNGDGTWSTTLSLAADTYEYKFQVNQWASQEAVPAESTCGVTIDEFTNRQVEVAAAISPTVTAYSACPIE